MCYQQLNKYVKINLVKNMRIISGKYKGKKIEGFNIDGTRPTMDRVKESLFAQIQDKIKDSICLDLFAGSGSLGIEALSCGSKECYFVDNNKEILKILSNNLKSIENGIVIKDDYNNALEYFKSKNIKFDLIFLDPPYKLNLINNSIEKILKKDLLNDNGLIICEYETELIKTTLKTYKEKKYGSKKIVILKK